MNKYKIWMVFSQPPTEQTTFDVWEVEADRVYVNDTTGQTIFTAKGDIVAVAPSNAIIKKVTE